MCVSDFGIHSSRHFPGADNLVVTQPGVMSPRAYFSNYKAGAFLYRKSHDETRASKVLARRDYEASGASELREAVCTSRVDRSSAGVYAAAGSPVFQSNETERLAECWVLWRGLALAHHNAVRARALSIQRLKRALGR